MHGVDTLLSPVSTDCLLEVVEEGIHRPFEPFLKVDYLKPKHRPEPLTLQPRPVLQPTAPRRARLSSSVLLIVFTLVSLIFTGSLSFAFFGERNSDVLADLLKDASAASTSGVSDACLNRHSHQSNIFFRSCCSAKTSTWTSMSRLSPFDGH